MTRDDFVRAEAQRESHCPLLTLGELCPRVKATDFDTKLVSMRTDGSHCTTYIIVASNPQSVPELTFEGTLVAELQRRVYARKTREGTCDNGCHFFYKPFSSDDEFGPYVVELSVPDVEGRFGLLRKSSGHLS